MRALVCPDKELLAGGLRTWTGVASETLTVRGTESHSGTEINQSYLLFKNKQGL